MRIAIGLSISFAAIAAIVYAAGSASVWDGVYMEAQASRGKEIFSQNCSACHGKALEGKNGPSLNSASFKDNWNGLSADDLFEYIKKSMPRGQAGILTREQTADVVAFLFTSNGFPAGQKELPNDAAVLQTIRFEAAKPTI
jgi:mono/diheme cytochrome c family protein